MAILKEKISIFPKNPWKSLFQPLEDFKEYQPRHVLLDRQKNPMYWPCYPVWCLWEHDRSQVVQLRIMGVQGLKTWRRGGECWPSLGRFLWQISVLSFTFLRVHHWSQYLSSLQSSTRQCSVKLTTNTVWQQQRRQWCSAVCSDREREGTAEQTVWLSFLSCSHDTE